LINLSRPSGTLSSSGEGNTEESLELLANYSNFRGV